MPAWRTLSSFCRSVFPLAAATLLLAMLPGGGFGQERETRPLTLDDLLTQHRFSTPLSGEPVAFSSRGNRFAYTLQRPGLQRGPGTNLGGNERADLWVAAGAEGEPRRITDGEPGNHGYWAPSWSPDGDHLALLSNRDGDMHLHVWDRDTGDLSRPSDQSTDPGLTTDPVWMSRSRLLFPVLPPGRGAPSLKLLRRTPELATQAWSDVADGSRVTVSMLESGAPVDRTSRPQAELLLHDVRSGETRVVFEGVVRDLVASPDREVVAGLVQTEVPPPAAGEPVPLPFPAVFAGTELRLFGEGGSIEAEALSTVRDVVPGSLHWAPDGSRIAFAGTPMESGASSAAGPVIFVYSLTTGALEPVDLGDLDAIMATSPFGTTPPRLSWTADGALVAYARGPAAGRPDWWVIRGAGEPSNLTEGLPAAPGRIHRMAGEAAWVGLSGGAIWRVAEGGGKPVRLTEAVSDPVVQLAWVDAEAGMSGGISEVVVRTRSEHGGEQLLRLELADGGRLQPIATPSADATLVGLVSEGGSAVFTQDNRSGLFLWTVAPGDSEPRTLVEANLSLHEIEDPEARLVEYESLDGDSLFAWVLIPPSGAPDLDRGRGLPVVTWVYAGDVVDPDRHDRLASVTYRGSDNLQLLTSRGYAVLLPSMPLPPPHLPGDPYELLPNGVLPAVDRVIELGIADPDRIAVMGQSYGGYSALGLVTQTNRFNAAVSVAGAANLVSFYGQLDAQFRYEASPYEDAQFGAMLLNELLQYRMGAPPWEDMDRYVRNSPITHVENVETPLLLVHGDLDFVGIQQAEEFFSALYRQGKRARFLRYWGEGHGIGSTANARDMWEQVFDWLDQHLNDAGGAPVRESLGGSPTLPPADPGSARPGPMPQLPQPDASR